MHEVSLMESLIALVEEQRRKQEFSRVHAIRLHVGALGHVDPDALRFCFDAVARGTIAAGARLEIDLVPGIGLCSECGKSVPLEQRFQACPVCGCTRVHLTEGTELRLTTLEVE